MMGLSPSFFVVVAELLACVWNINIHSKFVVYWETCNLFVFMNIAIVGRAEMNFQFYADVMI